VIQIPALREHRRNKLEKVLSVFNSSGENNSSGEKSHLVNIREDDYPKQYQAVIRRLLKAASEPDLRESMNIEDEYVEELESLERTIDEISAENRKISSERDEISAKMDLISSEKDQILQRAIQSLMEAKGIGFEEAKKLLT